MDADNDAEHIFHLIKHDSQLKQPLTFDEVKKSVTEAFNFLYSSQEEGEKFDLTPHGCFVIAVIQQVLICCLVKHVLQLMTAEALVLKKKNIPMFYLKNYLHNQAHFSLKDVITNYHLQIDNDM